MLKVAGSVAVVIALYYLIPVEKLSDSITIVFLWKIFLIVLFLLLMYVMKFFKVGEISVVKRLWNGREEKGVNDISDSV